MESRPSVDDPFAELVDSEQFFDPIVEDESGDKGTPAVTGSELLKTAAASNRNLLARVEREMDPRTAVQSKFQSSGRIDSGKGANGAGKATSAGASGKTPAIPPPHPRSSGRTALTSPPIRTTTTSDTQKFSNDSTVSHRRVNSAELPSESPGGGPRPSPASYASTSLLPSPLLPSPVLSSLPSSHLSSLPSSHLSSLPSSHLSSQPSPQLSSLRSWDDSNSSTGTAQADSASNRAYNAALSSDVRGFSVPRDESRHAAFLGIHALAEDAVYDDEKPARDRAHSGEESDDSDSSVKVTGAKEVAQGPVDAVATAPIDTNIRAQSAGAASLQPSTAPTTQTAQRTSTDSAVAGIAGPGIASGLSAFRPASKRSIPSSSASVASTETNRTGTAASSPKVPAAGIGLSATDSQRGILPVAAQMPIEQPAAPPSLFETARDDHEVSPHPAAPAPVSFWTAALRRIGWLPTPLPAGRVASTAVRRNQAEFTRLVLLQRLPHFSTQVVRARVGKMKARIRAQQAAAAADEQGMTLERRNSGRSSALSDSSSRGAGSDRTPGSEQPPKSGGNSSEGPGSSNGSGPGPARPAVRSLPQDGASASGESSQYPDTASIGGTSIASGTSGGAGGGRSHLPTSIASGAPLTEAIWTMKFSLDGQYLAVAGGTEAGAILRVWKVRAWDAPVRASRIAPARPLVTHGGPLFEKRPCREYLGHQTHIVDVAWSRSNLLLSASMDSFVRLWHVSRSECLHKFQHPDCVTAVAFHPTEDNFFVTGCLDKKLRIWSLETGRVVLWQPTASMITSVAFSPDARLVAVGLYNGMCMLYRSDGLRYHTTIECKNRKGKDRKGRKVTGLEFDANGTHLLVSTNDSRVRLISMDDFSQVYKYIGLRNNNMQIRATFDSSGDRIISGSEDRKVYVWRMRNDLIALPAIKPGVHVRQKVRACEWFIADDGIQPGDPRPSSTSGGLFLCGCGTADAAGEASQAPVAPRTAAMVSGSAAVVGSAQSTALKPAPDGGSDIDPEADDLEDRAEFQAYYTSGRIATTVAVFVPTAALAINRPVSAINVWKCPPTLRAEDHDRLSGVLDLAQTGNVVRSYHFMVVAADSRGFIRVFENTAPRQRL